MKKLIITVVVLGAIVGGYFYVLKYVRAPLSILEGELVRTRRGDLLVPITASGHIRPASVTNIKGEASGEVVEIPFEVGEMVHQGALIIRLDKTDEQRNVERAEADFERANIALEQAKLKRQEAQDVGVPLARAKLKRATAGFTLSEIALNKQKELRAMELADGTFSAASEQEYQEKVAMFEEAEANKEAAEAELTQAGIAVEMADKEIRSATESVKAAERILDDAKERLKETSVYAPIDGMVVDRRVQIGELVMSGTTSLTGGTIMIELADVSEIYAEINVDEADIGLVRELAPTSARPGGDAATRPATLPEGTIETGQKVEVTVEAYPEDTFYGVIERISPQSEVVRAIATFKVWIRITSDNLDMLKKVLNTQAQANFTAKSVTDAILVNYEAMKPNPDGEGYGVYVPVVRPGKRKPKPEFVPCQFGVDNRVDVEVIEGLDEGQKVYIKLPKKTPREQEAEQEAGE